MKLLYDSTEGLIYDFSLQPGDSIIIKTEPFHEYTLYLDSITDYIEYNTEIQVPENSRVFYFRKIGAYRPIWIEGIGSLTSPLTSEYAWGHGSLGEVLLCHYNSIGIKDYNDPEWQVAECQGDVLMNINQPLQATGLNIYPAPTNDRLIVESMFDNKIQRLQIINNLGKIILLKNNLNNLKTDLDIATLSQGIYLVKVEFQDKQIGIQKFIKH